MRTMRCHYNDVIMGLIASQIISLTVVFSTFYSDADQRKHQNSASLAFVRAIRRGPVNSPHRWPVTRKMFPFDDAIMVWVGLHTSSFTQIIQGYFSTNGTIISSHQYQLTHCDFVTPYRDIDLGQHRLMKWLAAWWHKAITWINVGISKALWHFKEIDQDIYPW